MPYVESITKAGRTIEIERYYTSRYGQRGQSRGERVKPTPEEALRINNRIAEKKLRRLINENFVPGDYHTVLSYAKARGEPHRQREEMKDDIAKFLRALRKEYRTRGQDLKYIHVPEVGARGARHHHLVLNKLDPEVIQKCWPHGRIHVNPLDSSGNYKDLAAYLIKYSSRKHPEDEKLSGKRWNASKNLRHPQPKIKIISQRSWYRTEATIPNKYRGKYIIDKDSIAVGIHNPEYSGYGYFRFTLVQLC
ncbi:MAG: hypothetical protein K6E95_00270 [Lachnospiraceae bacterium]|nr:hypothetical protein [Lachnospiraceae bacterium]